MSLPPTVDEADFLQAVERVAGVLSNKFRIPGLEPDDVKQQVAVYSLEAVERFDPDKGGLEALLYRHCSNRILNLRRNLGLRTDSPCRVCYSYARGLGAGHPDGSTCPGFDRWWARLRTRANLAAPLDISKVAAVEQEGGMWAASAAESDLATREVWDLLDDHLSIDLRADYLRMRAGDDGIPRARRERVLTAARAILAYPAAYEAQGASVTLEEPEFDDADDVGGRRRITSCSGRPPNHRRPP